MRIFINIRVAFITNGDWRQILVVDLVTIENFQLSTLQLPQKGACHMFLEKSLMKNFQKHMTCSLSWWLKTFSHHWTMLMCRMAIEFFWSPSNTPPPSDGNWNFSVAHDDIGRFDFFFSKNDITRAFLFGDRKILVAI